ncbi:MAG: T9SS type A sorting domain-containing protein [Flavipsychrobacter sp.]
MKLYIPLLLGLFVITTSVNAQINPKVFDGMPKDSTVFHFAVTDTIVKDTSKFYIQRTTKDSLWQIGTTQKKFFAAGGHTNAGIMTDSTNKYPINANGAFVINLDSIYGYYFNPIITFKHKYQTDSGKDGGYIEFSNDSGKTWNNIAGDCNVSNSVAEGVITQNIYTDKDTLQDGTPAFSGTSNGWQTSRFQFFHGFPLRTTGTGGPQCVKRGIQIRFKFVSDATADTLDGWIIDEIKVELDEFGGSVGSIKNNGALELYPNPATGVVHLPTLYRQEEYRIQLYDILGTKVQERVYTNKLDVSTLQRGLYYYRVSNDIYLYTGKLLLE